MAKRFPLPEFEYEELKGISWTAPALFEPQAVQERIDAAAFGAYPVSAPDAFFDALNVRGDWRTAVVCVLPDDGVTVTGRSHAWKRQCLVALDGLPAAAPTELFRWQTPRPMNTRLGPEDGIPAPARVMTLLCGHLFDDHWIGNRCAVDASWTPEQGAGFRVLWCDDEAYNDFHCAVASFTWDA